jgi:ABC-type amino acid transport substrate-binding protein
MKRIIPVVVALILLFAGTTWAGPVIDRILSRGELIVASSGDYPPMTAKTKQGKLIGMDIDLAGMIASAMGVKLTVVQMPFDKLLDGLQAGKADLVISCMTMTPKRNLKAAFVGPYVIGGQSLMTTREKSLTIPGLKDLNKPEMRLAVPKGTTSEQLAKKELPKVALTVAASMDEAVKLLVDGKVTAVMSDSAACAYAVLRHANKNLIATKPFTSEPLGIAVSPSDPLLVNFLTNLLLTLKGTNILDEMQEEWFRDPSWMKELP